MYITAQKFTAFRIRTALIKFRTPTVQDTCSLGHDSVCGAYIYIDLFSVFQPNEKKLRLEREYTSRQAKRQRRPKKLYKMAPGGEREQQKRKGKGG